MKKSATRFLISALFGAILLVAGLLLARYKPSQTIPAYPGIRVPAVPCLVIAGILLAGISLWLYFENKNRE
jgi:hypothetical protein